MHIMQMPLASGGASDYITVAVAPRGPRFGAPLAGRGPKE